MSNNDIIRENNKKLFESRLQIKKNSSLKINQISLKENKNKLKNKTNLYLFNTDIFHCDSSQNKRKDKFRIDNSLNNFMKKNIFVGKKKKEINKNRNKNNYLNINNNKSNLIIKDISFYQTKNSTLKNDIQIINVNKKDTTNNIIFKKIKKKKSNSNQKRNNKTKNALDFIYKHKRINQDKYSKSFLDFTYDNNKYNNQKISKSIVTLINNNSMEKRNNSCRRKYGNIYKSFLVQKIKIIKKKKKPYLNNINFNIFKNDNKSIRSNFLNKTGKNIKVSFYQNSKEKYVRNTYRNLFMRKGLNSSNKTSFINLNYNTNLNNSSLLINKKKISERNLKVKNINSLTLFQLKNKISHNKINRISKITKLKINNDINKNLKMNNSKNTKTTTEINFNQNQSNNINNNLSSKINKYIDKKEEIVDDFNIKSTKTNDDVFTESKYEKIEESSIEEESGILSMNEIEDIIIYNNMKNINKDDNYLFHKNDYNDYIKENKNKILFLFFDINNKIEENINKEIKTKIKLNKIKKEKSNIKNKNKLQNKHKEFKILSYNNSIKKEKHQFSHK